MPINRTSTKLSTSLPTKNFSNKKASKSTYIKFPHSDVPQMHKNSTLTATVTKQQNSQLKYDIASSFPSISENSKVSSSQAQEFLSWNLQQQITQLESENRVIFDQITKHSHHSRRSAFVNPKVHYEQNANLQAEISKLSGQLESTYKFCNGEMFEVLNSISEGYVELEAKLSILQNKSNKTKEEHQHLPLLEKVALDLKQLESKFQNLQRTGLNSDSQQTKEAAYIDSLLEKIEVLNLRKSFLEACKENLPQRKAYNAKNLQQLISVYESERGIFSGKVNQLRSELNQVEKVGKELTNHLIDYLEILKSYALKIRKPLISMEFTKHSINVGQERCQATQEKFDSAEFMLAANEVAKALTDLLTLAS